MPLDIETRDPWLFRASGDSLKDIGDSFTLQEGIYGYLVSSFLLLRHFVPFVSSIVYALRVSVVSFVYNDIVEPSVVTVIFKESIIKRCSDQGKRRVKR